MSLPLTLPSRYYTDPEQFRIDLDRFFLRKWVHAGRVDEIPETGDYVLRELDEESIILLRTEEDSIRAYYNVCRHRGTRLCEAAEGRFSRTIQCPYHAWTFDLQGRLVGAPHMEEVPGFQKEDWPLKRVAVAEWDGHLFLHLADNPPPLEAQLDELPRRFRPWGMAELRRGHRVVYDVAANWKLIIQNYSECLHCPVIHPALTPLSHYLSGDNEPSGSATLGGAMMLREGVASMTMDGKSRRACLPGLGPDNLRKVHFWAVLPNLLLSLHPDYMLTHTLWPRAVDRTEIVCEWHFHPDALASPDFSAEDAVAFWDLTNRQDWHISELSQRGLASRASSPGPYSHREELLYAFDQIYLRELEV